MSATPSPSTKDEDAADRTLERDVSRLVSDARDVRAAAAALASSAREAEQRYADEVDAALTTLEFDLRTAKASLDARRAESSDEIRGTLSDVEDAARTWLDDLALQARLGRMEARYRAEAAAALLDRARAEVQRAVGRVSDQVGSDLAEVRICVDDALQPRRCGRDVRHRCPRNTELRIPALR